MRYRHGDLIYIDWEYEPDHEYVRGHVEEVEARAAVEHELGYASGNMRGDVTHTYIRTVPTPHGEWDSVVLENCERGRGAIAVTKVKYRKGDV